MNYSKASLAAALVLSFALAASAFSAQDGKAVFEANKCSMCHSIEKAGITATVKMEAMKGPDLGGYKASDATPAFVKQEGELDGKKHKQKFKGTDEELQVILKWLASL